MRKTPLETKRAADERQARAEQLRMALVEERLARLAKAEEGRQEGRQQVAAIRAKVRALCCWTLQLRHAYAPMSGSSTSRRHDLWTVLSSAMCLLHMSGT